MNTKKVWSIILIVFGLLFAIYGFNGYFTVSFLGNEVESTNKLIERYGGNIPKELYNIERDRSAISNSKAIQVIIMLLGILGILTGTAMLKEIDSKELSHDDFDDNGGLPPINDKWKM